MTNTVLLVVTSLLASQTPEWVAVSDALATKHQEEAKVLRLTAAGPVTNELAAVRAAAPTHVAFVMRPEEIDFPTVIQLKRMMRDLDNDPYDDAKWGLVTGPTAADALRIASSSEPKVLTTALATTGVDDAVVPGPVVCLSDAYPAGCWRIKDKEGRVTHHSSSNDTSHVFAEAWNDFDPDFIITSSHASQRNLEMPFSQGNVFAKDGRFVTWPNATLIDYRTGQAKPTEEVGSPEEAAVRPILLKAPVREKVWLAAGNCLIADNLRPGDNMIMSALGFGKVNQFVGYIATTWFGEIGWTTWKNFREGQSLVDAYFAANEQLIRELEEDVSNASSFRPFFARAAEYDRLFRDVQQFRFRAVHKISDQQKFVGRLWDRDATVFYGDPLHKVYLKENK